MHFLLAARTNLALTYLHRARPEDRPLAASLLHQALAAAAAMGIPEAGEIREILRKHGLD